MGISLVIFGVLMGGKDRSECPVNEVTNERRGMFRNYVGVFRN